MLVAFSGTEDQRSVTTEAIITRKEPMTGEKLSSGLLAWPEPGGRQPAPRALALVQAFMNTHYDRAISTAARPFSAPPCYTIGFELTNS